jgi:hypothetical protein
MTEEKIMTVYSLPECAGVTKENCLTERKAVTCNEQGFDDLIGNSLLLKRI